MQESVANIAITTHTGNDVRLRSDPNENACHLTISSARNVSRRHLSPFQSEKSWDIKRYHQFPRCIRLTNRTISLKKNHARENITAHMVQIGNKY
jgi:hypothetical protein